MAGLGPVSIIEVPKTPAPQGLHHPTDAVLVARCRQPMYVVGYEHEGMDNNVVFICRVPEKSPVGFVIRLAVDAGFSIVATLGHMLGATGKVEAWEAGYFGFFWMGRGRA